ncbi:MAG: TrmH family RNA methyltransferase [Acidobacteria bacterium]|nr:MAG: TrmH family RNA methyltransferase [Acidobacteriota bacterium]
MERLPYRATQAARVYEDVREIPVAVLLDNVRSLYNVGAFFRTADAAGLRRLYLCGITGRPPHRGISKTALDAEKSVPWEHAADSLQVMRTLRSAGYEMAAVETSNTSVDLFDWKPAFPVCLIFGNEIEGIRLEVANCADTHVRIPMLGVKHSLNVSTAGGVVIYELLRKYLNLAGLYRNTKNRESSDLTKVDFSHPRASRILQSGAGSCDKRATNL